MTQKELNQVEKYSKAWTHSQKATRMSKMTSVVATPQLSPYTSALTPIPIWQPLALEKRLQNTTKAPKTATRVKQTLQGH